MSAHESLSCSPASRMSGGDYDGDKAFIIGFEPLVNEASRILGEVKGWMYFQSAWWLPPGFQLGLPLEVQPPFFFSKHHCLEVRLYNHSKQGTIFLKKLPGITTLSYERSEINLCRGGKLCNHQVIKKEGLIVDSLTAVPTWRIIPLIYFVNSYDRDIYLRHIEVEYTTLPIGEIPHHHGYSPVMITRMIIQNWRINIFCTFLNFIFDLWGKVFKPLIFHSQLSTAELLFIGGEGDFQHQAAGKLRSQRDRCGWKRWTSKLLDGSFGVPDCFESKGLTVTPKNEQRVYT